MLFSTVKLEAPTSGSGPVPHPLSLAGGLAPVRDPPLPLHMLYPPGRLGNGLSGMAMVSPTGRGSEEMGKAEPDLAASGTCTSELAGMWETGV